MSETKKHMQFLNSLTEAFGSSDDMSIDEVKKELAADGVDVENTMKELMNDIHDISMSAKRLQLEEAKNNRLLDESNRKNVLSKLASYSKDALISLINDKPDFSFAFREQRIDLESMDVEDLKSLVEDAGLLEEDEKD